MEFRLAGINTYTNKKLNKFFYKVLFTLVVSNGSVKRTT